MYPYLSNADKAEIDKYNFIIKIIWGISLVALLTFVVFIILFARKQRMKNYKISQAVYAGSRQITYRGESSFSYIVEEEKIEKNEALLSKEN